MSTQLLASLRLLVEGGIIGALLIHWLQGRRERRAAQRAHLYRLRQEDIPRVRALCLEALRASLTLDAYLRQWGRASTMKRLGIIPIWPDWPKRHVLADKVEATLIRFNDALAELMTDEAIADHFRVEAGKLLASFHSDMLEKLGDIKRADFTDEQHRLSRFANLTRDYMRQLAATKPGQLPQPVTPPAQRRIVRLFRRRPSLDSPEDQPPART